MSFLSCLGKVYGIRVLWVSGEKWEKVGIGLGEEYTPFFL
jgi:hypothetical protein